MTELESRLLLLGAEIVYPRTPELDARALAPHPGRERSPWRLRAVVACAVALAVAGAVLAASPGARSALRDLLGLGGASIVRVDVLPEPGALTGYVPGRVVSLDAARNGIDYRLRLPETGAPPARVVLDESVAGGAVSIVWCCEPELVLTQFPGTSSVDYIRKLAGPATTIDPVDVEGRRGFWLEGAPHIVVFVDRLGAFHDFESRVAGNVLLWTDGDVTLRLEGRITRDEALAIAATIR